MDLVIRLWLRPPRPWMVGQARWASLSKAWQPQLRERS